MAVDLAVRHDPGTRSSSLSGQTVPNEKNRTSSDAEKASQISSSPKNATDDSKEDTPPVAGDGNEYPGTVSLILIVVALVLSIFLVALDMTIVATAIPQITDEFKSLDQVGWYGSAFFLTVASFQSTWGKGYKYFQLKWTFLLAVFVFEVGSLICGVAQNSTTLIVGRAIAGVGAAGISSGVYIIIAFSAPPQRRPAFTGLIGATFALASVVGPLLGGVFTSHVSWRWCFYINLPIGGVGAAIIVIFFTTPPAARPVPASLKEKLLQMDFLGSFTIMAAVICYLLALQWGGATKKWSNSDVIGTLIGFGLLLILFIVIEWWMNERGLIPRRLLKSRTFVACCVYIFLLCGPMFILIYYLPIYFQSIKNVSAAQSGIRSIPLILSISIFTILSGGLVTAFGHFVYLMVLASAFTVAGSALIYTLEVNTGAGKWIGYQIVAGVGLGLGCQLPIIVNQAIVDPSDLAASSAFTLFLQTIGSAIWVSAGQAAFVNRLVQKLPQTAPNVNPVLAVATGATDLRRVFSADQISGILEAYMDGLKVAYLIGIVLASVSVVVAFAPKWQSLKGKVTMGAA